MSEQETKTDLWKWVLAAVSALAVIVLAASVSLVAVMGGALGGGNSGDSGPVCEPGEGGSEGVEIPSEYEDFVDGASAESGLSVGILGAQLKHESDWDPEAESSAGAQGIAQFMPRTWDEWGEDGDPFDPADAIAAQGRYMGHMYDLMEPEADDEEDLIKLSLAAYNAGPGAVKRYDYDLDDMFSDSGSPGYQNETKPYVENIVSAAEGDYTADCEHDDGGGGSVPEGEIPETSEYLAWEERVELPRSTAGSHGKEDAKPEFVEAADELASTPTTAYYTDCGVFVATVMRSSGVDPDYPARGTGVQLSYVNNSDKYETFSATSEGELEPGDILVRPGHTYLFTGERNSSDTGRAQGASLYTRPPSGHNILLDGGYTVARHKG